MTNKRPAIFHNLRLKAIPFGLSVIGGCLLGYWLAPRGSERFNQQSSGSHEVALLQAKIKQLESKLAEAASEKSGALRSVDRSNQAATRQVDDDLQVLARMTKDKLAKFRVPVVAPTGKISNQLIELFNLTPNEVEDLQSIIGNLRAFATDHAAENATLVRADDSSATISVPPIGDLGKIRDLLTTSIEGILGKERYAVFMILEGEELSRAVGVSPLGRNFVVRLNKLSDGSSSLLVEDYQIGQNGKSLRSGGIGVPPGEPFPEHLAWLTRFQPHFVNLQPAFNSGRPISERKKPQQ